MTTSTATRSDQDLQTAVQAELEWTPAVEAPGKGVAVVDGAVTLSLTGEDVVELKRKCRGTGWGAG